MKYLIYWMIFNSMIVFSCSEHHNSETPKENRNPEKIKTRHNIDSLAVIHDLSKYWIQVTKTDSGYIKYISCENNLRSIRIIGEDDCYKVLINWGYALTKHKIISLIKKNKSEYFINALFGKDRFTFELKFMQDSLAFWRWNWNNSLDGTKKYFSGYFASENTASTLKEVKEPCYRCHEPEFCTDYFMKFFKEPVNDLIADKYFIKRISELCQNNARNILNAYNDTSVITPTEDSLIILNSPDQKKLIVIDTKENLIFTAIKNKQKIISKYCEGNESQYPEVFNHWISRPK